LYKTHNFYQISLRPLIKIDKRKFSQKFSVELYEPFTLESWGILSQLGFISIVSIFLTIFKMNIEEVLNYIKAFPGFKIPGMNENYRIIRNSKYRFNDIVGSEYILPKLAEVILYLINTGHLLSRISIVQPKSKWSI
jgi:hypothetical protein